MCIENWMSYITTLQNWIPAGVIGFVASILITRLKHRYDTKLAKINARLDNEKNERQSISDFLYNNLHQRQSLLYEKQIQAIETIWKKTCELQSVDFLLKMSEVNLTKLSDINKSNTSYQEASKMILQISKRESMRMVDMDIIQPYLPELLYTYYEAYSNIIMHHILESLVFKTTGSTNNSQYTEKIKQFILAIFPNRKDFIEDPDVNVDLGHLLKELRKKILDEIKLFLDGNPTTDIEKVKKIKSAITDIENDNQELNEKLTK